MAKIHGITSKMLRYYDEIGLFLPEKVDRESGYRLYSRNQDPMLQWILTLKSLGFSLEEIKELFIGPVDSGKLIRALAKKKVEITREFQHSLFKSLQIQKLLSMIEKEGFIMDKTVDLSKLDVNELMDIKKKLPNMDMLVEDVENLLRKGLTGTTFGFIRYDIRKFLEINRHDGYEVGDRVIVALYKVFEDTLQEHGLNHGIARAGGDEFVAFLEGSFEEVKSVSHRIMDQVRSIDFHSLGCHRPIDGYLSAVITSTKSVYHPRELIDDTYFALKEAHEKAEKGQEALVLIEK